MRERERENVFVQPSNVRSSSLCGVGALFFVPAFAVGHSSSAEPSRVTGGVCWCVLVEPEMHTFNLQVPICIIWCIFTDRLSPSCHRHLPAGRPRRTSYAGEAIVPRDARVNWSSASGSFPLCSEELQSCSAQSSRRRSELWTCHGKQECGAAAGLYCTASLAAEGTAGPRAAVHRTAP